MLCTAYSNWLIVSPIKVAHLDRLESYTAYTGHKLNDWSMNNPQPLQRNIARVYKDIPQ